MSLLVIFIKYIIEDTFISYMGHYLENECIKLVHSVSRTIFIFVINNLHTVCITSNQLLQHAFCFILIYNSRKRFISKQTKECESELDIK